MTNLNSHSSIHFHQAVKALYSSDLAETPRTGKSLAGAAIGTDPALGSWLEENQPTYLDIQNGTSSLSQADQAQFMEWWSWAADQLSGASSDWGSFDMTVDDETTGTTGGSMDAIPFGCQLGTMGNFTFTEEKFRGGFIGNGTYDIWSTDVLLQVAPLSAKVTIEYTTDTRFNPPEDVRKITVTDAATGTEAVYFIHDETAELEIQTAKQEQITDYTSGGYDYNKFVPGSLNAEAANEASVEGIEENGQLVYEGRVGETISFNSTGGSDQEHVVWGDADITVGTRDRVAVYASEIADSANEGETIPATKIVVNHPDGTSDTYFVPQGMDFKTNINAIESRITWGSDGLAAELGDALTINAGGEEDADAVEVSGDEPTSVDGTDRTFDSSASADLYTRKDGGTSNVFARNDVTLHASSNQEYWVVGWDFENQRYVVEVYADDSKTELKETIYIDNMADALKLDIDPSQVEFSGSLMTDLAPQELNTGVVEAEKIQFIGTDGAESNEANPAANWPNVEIVANVPTSDNEDYNGNQYNHSLAIVNLLNTAIHAGTDAAWNDVISYIDSLAGAAGGRKDNIIRKVMTAIFKGAGSDQDQFMELLGTLPENVRQKMRDCLSQDALEKNGDEQWNSSVTAAMLDESLNG